MTLGNGALSAADQINALSLSNTGVINVSGNTATHQALINLNSAAGFGTAGILTGSVLLTGDAAIEFSSGSLTTVAAGASLTMSGGAAFIETATALGQNSALNKLTSDLGAITLHSNVAIASTNRLSIAVQSGLVQHGRQRAATVDRSSPSRDRCPIRELLTVGNSSLSVGRLR